MGNIPEKLTKPYSPKDTEGRIYDLWEKSGYFNPDNLPRSSTQTETWTTLMPPPNANGRLHAGHALDSTLKDILARFKRMQGKKVLMIPGSDHAGFETQGVYEKELQKQGRSRFGMSNQDLYKEIYDFVIDKKQYMEDDWKKLGLSCDWSRNLFTLDPKVISKVQDNFIKMFNDGLIYRGSRIVHWNPKYKTSLSDIETDFIEKTDKFYYFQYGPFVISTARPETKFGDKYVVVNPNDERYKEYEHGQQIEIEWINGPLIATVIKDEASDPNLGTGAMTITPWHSQVDFDLAQKYNLDMEQIIDWDGKLLPIADEFAGMKIDEAREKIVEKLKAKGLLVKIDENYKHSVRVCERTGVTIEPQIKPQWFVKMKPFADMVLDSLDKGEFNILTESHEKIFRHWMSNPIDWNISRQIVWGIQIPAWFKTNVGSEMEAVHFKEEVLCKKLGLNNEQEFDKYSTDLHQTNDKNTNISWLSNRDGIIQLHIGYIDFLKQKGVIDDIWIKENRLPRNQIPSEIYIGKNPPEETGWVQDPDTFDTWFSSGQWPLLTLGYPDGEDMKNYYPTQLMETGTELIFKWIPRMIMFGKYLTGEVPFKDIYLHGMVLDKDGKKMSKSKGNVISPIDVADSYGIDALRMALIVGTPAGADTSLSLEKINGYKKFANKIWNASRFVLENTADFDQTDQTELTEKDKEYLAQLNKVISEITTDLDNYRLHLASEKIYHYFWHVFADTVIEDCKNRIKNGTDIEKKSAQYTLKNIFETSIKLLHPFMPFITEEIWGIINDSQDKILMIEPWPIFDDKS